MANRSFANVGRIFAPHTMPVVLDCNFVVGASGAVGTLKGPMISSVTRLSTGRYRVKFDDNYNRFYGMSASVEAPETGADIGVGSITPGVVYVITAVGTTTAAQWLTAGVPAGITPAVGVPFLAAATSAGTGQVKAVGVSGVQSVEVVGDPQLTLAPTGYANYGGSVVVQTLGATAAGDTTMIPVNPAQNSVVFLSFYLSNSNVLVQGE